MLRLVFFSLLIGAVLAEPICHEVGPFIGIIFGTVAGTVLIMLAFVLPGAIRWGCLGFCKEICCSCRGDPKLDQAPDAIPEGKLCDEVPIHSPLRRVSNSQTEYPDSTLQRIRTDSSNGPRYLHGRDYRVFYNHYHNIYCYYCDLLL